MLTDHKANNIFVVHKLLATFCCAWNCILKQWQSLKLKYTVVVTEELQQNRNFIFYF